VLDSLSVSALQSYWAGNFLVSPDASAPRISGFNDGGSGLAGNPNDLALTLNLMIPLAVALLIMERAIAARAVAALALLLAVGGVIVTFSRAGFVTLVIIALLSVVPMLRRAPPLRCSCCSDWCQHPWMLPTGYTQRLTRSPTSRATRPDQHRAMGGPGCRRRYRDSHACGRVGLGQNVLALNRERGPTWRMVHNVYLQYAVDLGVPGLLLFLWLFVSVFRRVPSCADVCQHGYRHCDQVGVAARGVQIALCAFAVSALFYPVAYQFYFFLIAGLALAVDNVWRTRSAHSDTRAPEPARHDVEWIDPGTQVCRRCTRRHRESGHDAQSRTRDAGFDLEVACMHRAGPLVNALTERDVPLREYPITSFLEPTSDRSTSASGSSHRQPAVRTIVHAYSFYGNVFAHSACRSRGRASDHRVGARPRCVSHTAPDARRDKSVTWRTAFSSTPRQSRNGSSNRDTPEQDRRHSQRRRREPLRRTSDSNQIRQQLGLAPGERMVTVVSRVTRLKGLEQFIDAASLLAPWFPTVRFLIAGDASAGDGDYVAALKQRAEQMGVGGRVLFAGHRFDVPAVLGSAAVSVMPSLNEALSNVLSNPWLPEHRLSRRG
jgi:glycosyltransferase involved in cell wall biosynthesis